MNYGWDCIMVKYHISSSLTLLHHYQLQIELLSYTTYVMRVSVCVLWHGLYIYINSQAETRTWIQRFWFTIDAHSEFVVQARAVLETLDIVTKTRSFCFGFAWYAWRALKYSCPSLRVFVIFWFVFVFSFLFWFYEYYEWLVFVQHFFFKEKC